ncbi:FHA domain-containing protein [Thermoleophilia bacterium SCSIO 60948]|nr:FHA domain-containing protein [Thermoleophilia bacterium SCSIO 60948]
MPLGRATVLVGRSADATISLAADKEVSSLHAELEPVGGEWLLVDDGLSRNGTYVNAERIAGRRRLRDRDLIRCGRTTILFRTPAAGARDATAVATDRPAPRVTDAQRRVLVALCRPFASGSEFATTATNREIADELFLSVDAVKSHLRALFDAFELGEVAQNEKRVRLAEAAVRSGTVTARELLD